MQISENDVLFSLIGTTYGGDGQETFGLPDLQGRIPLHQGQGPGISQSYVLGQKDGVESVTLTVPQTPVHTHALIGSSSIATDPSPSDDVLATSSLMTPYVGLTPDEALAANAIGIAGGSQPHDNMMPYLVVSFIISLFGIYPTQN